MNTNKKIFITKSNEYDRYKIYNDINLSVDQLGGLERLVSKNDAVVLKPNMLQGSAPDTSIVTHPDVVYAIARILVEHGCRVTLADSPGSGHPFTESTLENAYAITGYKQIADDLGISLNYNTEYVRVDYPSGTTVKRFSIIKTVAEADSVVVVSKAKTHMLTNMTGAAKNIFGVIPGLEKPTYHARYPHPLDFSRVIVDLNELVKPRLQVMDAIIGMEGNGPLNGSPKKIGAVLVGNDYTAMDVVTSRLMSINPLNVPTILAAIERGLIRSDLRDVMVLGNSIDSLIAIDYKTPCTYNGTELGKVEYSNKISFNSSIRPTIIYDKCVACKKCMISCPVKAISFINNKPSIDYTRCIRCYCCHEMCDNHAIELDRLS